jgi:hypothetical protein
VKIIGVPEVLVLDDVVWWTHVALSFMTWRGGHVSHPHLDVSFIKHHVDLQEHQLSSSDYK